MSILIAESGSTKTDWRLIHVNGTISQFKTIGINPFYQDEASIYNEINDKIGINITEPISFIYYYGTGVTNHDKSQIIKKALLRAFPIAKVEVFDDMIAAARSLCLGEPGIACILGTGSNSCVYDGRSITSKIPALGFWLGDEGSGGYLGKELIKKYIRKELPAEIHQKFVKRYGQLERTEILEKAYTQPFPNRYFANFAKFIFDNRTHPFLDLLVSESFELFFEKSVLKYPECQKYKIHFTGSIAFYFSDILRKAAIKHHLIVGIIMESPIAGLVLYHKKE